MSDRNTGKAVATFSIVAADVETGDVGIAVASKFLAAGAVVPWANAGAGAVATQSYSNATFGPRGIALMREGKSAPEALAELIAGDSDPNRRQVGVVDAKGGSAAHTGSICHPWAGHFVGPGFCCQGNLLTGKQTVTAMAESFQSSKGPLAERLCQAIHAGEAAGGDRRGRQAAALYVARDKGGYLGFNDRLIDLRVDDHVDPVGELTRLLALHNLYFGSSPATERIPLAGPVLTELKTIMQRTRQYQGAMDDSWNAEVKQAIDAFAGTENLEERIDLEARTIDPPALTFLRSIHAARK